jgi:hypothetical protein
MRIIATFLLEVTPASENDKAGPLNELEQWAVGAIDDLEYLSYDTQVLDYKVEETK